MWLFLRFYFTPPNSRSLKCLAWILFEESTQMNRAQYWFMRLCCQHEMLTFKQHHDHNSRAELETSFRCSRSVKTHRETEISRVWLSVCVWGWNEQTKSERHSVMEKLISLPFLCFLLQCYPVTPVETQGRYREESSTGPGTTSATRSATVAWWDTFWRGTQFSRALWARGVVHHGISQHHFVEVRCPDYMAHELGFPLGFFKKEPK